MSSTILYLAIVAIWAGVLVPRWLRREPHRETSTHSRDAAVIDGGTAGMAVGAPGADEARPRRGAEAGWQPSRSDRARAMAARRRLFGILVALAFAATTIAVAGLATWWVVVPPAGMLAGYVILLREAARADAEIWAAHDATATAGPSAHRQVSARPVTRSAAPADDQVRRPVAAVSPARVLAASRAQWVALRRPAPPTWSTSCPGWTKNSTTSTPTRSCVR